MDKLTSNSFLRPNPFLRQGPRPLGLLLSLAFQTYGALSLQYFTYAKALSNFSKEDEKIKPALDKALANQKEWMDFLTGVEKYLNAPFFREQKDYDLIWQKETVKLYGFSDLKAQPILLIPSLVNKYYIFDLYNDHSFINYLIESGYAPLILDWGDAPFCHPDFKIEDYFSYYLKDLLHHTKSFQDQKPIILGYCMGGNFALIVSLFEKEKIKAFISLATPWRFDIKEFEWFKTMNEWLPVKKILNKDQSITVDELQSLFIFLKPHLTIKKFINFGRKTEKDDIEKFTLLEDWLNDGVPLGRGIAQECFIGWYLDNTLFKGQWKVNNVRVNPKEIDCPTFIICPKKDYIVPYDCSYGLSEQCPQANVFSPDCGHIGAMASKKSKKMVWQAVNDWIKTNI